MDVPFVSPAISKTTSLIFVFGFVLESKLPFLLDYKEKSLWLSQLCVQV